MTTTMTADMTLVHAATTAASQPSTLLWLIPFLPLFGFLVNGLSGKKLRNTQVVDFIALGSVGVAFLLTLYHFIQLVGLPADGRSIHQSLWTWFDVGGARVLGGLSTYKIEWAYKFDALSGAMALLVTGAGFLIHLFSTGYMAEERNDGRYYRFMAYLNLFVFSMLNLVLGANIMMMFLGWEGVGLCSYLLIGFYFDKEYAAIAGKKAFVTNRIGDFGFMIGFFLIFMVFGSLDYDTLMGSVREISSLKSITLFGLTHAPVWWFNLIGCCLFVGAAGKSAQIPLYVWLPDAMAGPTPVSALIHAATMVTSGLYMITRLNFIYVQAPVALAVVLFVGALTAFVAASMGLAQYDIKKVLAYSTVSQLGFMFMGLGAGAFTAGMFHVFTHAAFKACLFLGSGSVIMACHHEQDMRNMGGLRKYMPWTFLSMGLATLAIAGIFPFSGFFSKDEILWKVFEGWYHHGAFDGPALNLVAWILGMLGAFMTAFYMTRLMIMTFYGEYRGAGHDPYHLTVPSEAHHGADDHGHDAHGHDDHAHAAPAAHGHGDHGHGPTEVPWNMWLPVFIFAIFAVILGFLNLPHSLETLGKVFGNDHFSKWLEPLLYQVAAPEHGHHAAPFIEYALMFWATLFWAPGAILLAVWIYGMDPSWSKARAFVTRFPKVFEWVNAKYYVDEFYEWAIIEPLKRFSAQLWSFDTWVVDGMVNGAARVTLIWAELMHWVDEYLVDGAVDLTEYIVQETSGVFRGLQSGRVQHYAFVMFLGFLAFAVVKFLV
ncbi:MAG: NADH-quinone oxidoreductase subunit L [Geothrix sp.]|uniref:NADH-quinone oxidoreductase subunit L n=1 Tax=Geothrix sp. TaxID=1962974 RepID=UPI0017DE6FFC|nr:NADH-quinone oxidoreductase subunit L [Geothrix sp.]NWJ42163.1 NADH-quinone oxidoreductase subunit L [Geothrix sp.]WIL19874.1 MAG: NADH-quinone oxidoreductase subunit L [Geothrix sp.]